MVQVFNNGNKTKEDCYSNETVDDFFEEESYYREEPDDYGDYYHDMIKDDGLYLDKGYWTFWLKEITYAKHKYSAYIIRK